MINKELTPQISKMVTDTVKIKVQQAPKSRIAQLDYENIDFGKIISDHMLVVDYKDGAWQEPQIMPYGPLSMSPAISAIHYGQALFEGMKAYLNPDKEILLFRPLANHKRLNISAQRLCMPTLPEEIFMEGLIKLLNLDHKWVPPTPGCSLYIRPVMFATDEFIGVRPSSNYKFVIFTCPVGAYYGAPVRVKVEEHYVRSVEGGAGFAKAAGNYAAALYPAKLAQNEGYHQLIWMDAQEHKYIEESGTMNVMFVIDGKLITPAVSSSILSGITRDSVLTLARDWGMTVEERRVSIDEVMEAHRNGTLTEAFGTGTAATIAPIATIGYQGVDYDLPASENREFSNRVSAELDKIRTGQMPDPHGWTFKIPKETLS